MAAKPSKMEQASNYLKSIWNHDELRPLQRETIQHLFDGHDVLSVLPTSYGKTATFVLPGLVQGGITLVFVPTLSLIKDQMAILTDKKIECFALSGDATLEQRAAVFTMLNTYSQAPAGDAPLPPKIFYATPEMLEHNDLMRKLLSTIHARKHLCRIVIDEAHTLVWQYTFRKSMKILNELKTLYKGVQVLALTATATPKMSLEIQRTLELKEAKIVRTSFQKPNLAIEVREKNGMPSILDALSFLTSGSGIVYCCTRNDCSKVCEYLKGAGVTAGMYHGAMNSEEREKSQNAWIGNVTQVMVATIAFGMGIDKPDVRLVVNYGMTKSLDDYYQEIGRAGRDGKECRAILLTKPSSDRQVYIHLMKAGDPPSCDNSYSAQEQEDLDAMTAFATNRTVCRQQLICTHFGEVDPEECGKCDNCLFDGVREEDDETEIAKMIVSTVYRLNHYAFKTSTKTKVVDAYQLKHPEAVKKSVTARVERTLEHLIQTSLIKTEPTVFNGHRVERFVLYEEAMALSNFLIPQSVPPLTTGTASKSKRASAKTSPNQSSQNVNDSPASPEDSLVAELRDLRRMLAQQSPAYIVFTDAMLRQLVIDKPDNLEKLRAVHGFGPKRLEKYGEQIVQLLAAHNASCKA